MKKFIANIQVGNKIVQEEVVLKNKLEAEEYFENYIEYWSKVWQGWKGSYLISIEEKFINE